MTEVSAAPVTVRRLAPGPRGKPLLGSLDAFRRDPMVMFLDLRREYGDVVRIRLGPYLVHVILGPEGVRHVLQVNQKNYSRGKFYENFKRFFGIALLTTDGQHWLGRRRLAQPIFHRKVVEGYTTTVTDTTARFLERWAGVVVQLLAPGGRLLDVDLSVHPELLGENVVQRLRMMMPGSISDAFPRWVPTLHRLKVARSQRSLYRTMQGIFNAYLQDEHAGTDLIALLRSARDPETGELLDEEELHDQFTTLLLAGYETTGTGLAWTLYALSKHVEVRRRLEAELDEVLGGRVPTADDLARLPYTAMVVQESLRVYPPIWAFTRDPVEDDEIGGYHIPGGSTVIVSPYAVHRHPAYWENPEAFDPERFTPERSAGRPPFAYMPFGGSPRKCIGYQLALVELQLCTAMIAQRFRVHAVPGHPVGYGPLVSLKPLHGIQATLHPRV